MTEWIALPAADSSTRDSFEGSVTRDSFGGSDHHNTQHKKRKGMVVIVGAGIAGAATAYYLVSCQQQTPLDVTIIDAAGRPAACASGTAGAYLSSHWGLRTKRDTLFRKSFALHEELARDLDLSSFHYVSSYRVEIGEGEEECDSAKEKLVVDEQTIEEDTWMDRVASIESLPGSSAIVDPEELTQALVNHVFQKGATFMAKSVCGFDLEDKTVTSIRFDDGDSLDVKKDEDVVLALGPWSSRIEDWFHIPMPVDGVLSTSLIWDNNNNTTDDSSSFTVPSHFTSAVFCEEDSNGCHLEILPRKNNTLYVSGCGESEVWSPQVFRNRRQCPRPEEPCVPNMAQATAARKSLRALLYHEKDGASVVPPPNRVQACIRPVSPDGVPIVGRLQPLRNVFVATGGGPWGITFGPLMGKCLATLVLNRDEATPPLRLASLAPSRFDTILYRTFLEQRKSPKE
eukprot:scaffold46860_cov168-Amphora_coffeaeformis.AAC.2